MTGGTVAAMVNADLVTEQDNPWVEVFDATRVGGAQATKKFVKENALVAIHFAKDRAEGLRAADISKLEAGEGGMVNICGVHVQLVSGQAGLPFGRRPRMTSR